MQNLIFNEQGYFELVDKPTSEELAKYYRDLYYQEETSQYSKSYSDEELQFFETGARECLYIYEHVLGGKDKSLLDVGCGEGWVLNEFKKQGYNICGVDYSLDPVSHFNPHLMDDFISGDFNEILPQMNRKFGLIVLKNVLEHVIKPNEIIAYVLNLLTDDGVLMVHVPNDFSKLHSHLIKNNMVGKKFWISPPDHLNYFTHTSLNQFMLNNGFTVSFESADYPIDFDLLVPERNYIENKRLGSSAHLQRIRVENFIAQTSIENLVKYHNVLGEAGFGRSVVNFYKRTASESKPRLNRI